MIRPSRKPRSYWRVARKSWKWVTWKVLWYVYPYLIAGRLSSKYSGAQKRFGLLQSRHLPVPRTYVNHDSCTGDLPGAIESWKEALAIAPDSPDAHTNLASAYIMSKPPQGELALDHLKYVSGANLRTAAELSPDDGEIQFNLATVLEACAYMTILLRRTTRRSYPCLQESKGGRYRCT